MDNRTPQLPLFTTVPNDPTTEIPYGYCHCGCGRLTSIAKHTNAKLGHIKGQPVRYCPGHVNRTKHKRPIEERFWEKVDRRGPDECWEWQASRRAHGYGNFAMGKRKSGSHKCAVASRVAWELTYGSIPDGMDVCHICDNPPCCNPAHFFLGTQTDNTKDMHHKGRGSNPPVHREKGEKAPNAHYSNAQVREFRREFAELTISINKFARLHHITVATMRKILKRISYPNA